MGTTLTGTVTCHPGDTSDTGHQAGDTTNTRHTTDTGHEAWHAADTRQHPCTWREAEQSEHPKMPHAAGRRACGYGPLKQSQKLEHQRAQHLPECLLRDQCPHAHPPGLGRTRGRGRCAPTCPAGTGMGWASRNSKSPWQQMFSGCCASLHRALGCFHSWVCDGPAARTHPGRGFPAPSLGAHVAARELVAAGGTPRSPKDGLVNPSCSRG